MSVLYGRKGDKNGGKIIKTLFGKLMDSMIRSLFTWTGKSIKGKKKIAFKTYEGVIGLLYAVVHLADKTYSMKDCEYDLTYKVLKHASTSKRCVCVYIQRSISFLQN